MEGTMKVCVLTGKQQLEWIESEEIISESPILVPADAVFHA